MFKTKEEVRRYIWKKLVEENLALPPFPLEGRIPNFIGSEKAALKVSKLDVFKKARFILVNPDSPQKPVRELVLKHGKTLIIPTPKLKHGFRIIDSKDVLGKESYAVTIKGIFRYGKPIKDLGCVDLIIMGSVAVDIYGNRIGKGGGYGDKEISMIRRKNSKVTVVTTVHDIQVFTHKLPCESHDQRIDIIVTPTRIIYTKRL